MNNMSQSSLVLSLAWTQTAVGEQRRNRKKLITGTLKIKIWCHFLGISLILLRIRQDQLITWALISALSPPTWERQKPACSSTRAQIQRKVVQIWKRCRYTHSLWWIRQVHTQLCAWSWGWELFGFVVICKILMVFLVPRVSTWCHQV